ncbi:hypothetical protein [Parvibaculum sp.]|uniref:hypothetical protein n=1 Tax=Parvibaculum sp. TaxID=2024848 RepID=UPI00320FD806
MNTRAIALIGSLALSAIGASSAFAAGTVAASPSVVASFQDNAERQFGTYHGGKIAVSWFPAEERGLAAQLDQNHDGYLDLHEYKAGRISG